MALFDEQNEQDLLNIIQGGQNQTVANQPSPFQQIAFSRGFQQESEPSQQYMFNALRNQGISNENLLYSLQQQFGPESASYWQNLLTPQKQAPSQNVVAPAQNVVAPTQNVAAPAQDSAPPQNDVLQILRDAGLKYQPISVAQDMEFQLPGNQQVLQKQPITPEWFKNYIYQGGADDAAATQRGIDYVLSEGMRPQDAVNLWNQSLGTNFSVSDLFKQTGSGPVMSNFGDSYSWKTGEKAENDPVTGMIKSAGSYFQKGNESVVSDELFWNPNSPTGKDLQQKIEDARNQGQRPGIVITPYAVFQGKATNEQLLNEVANSGADFVALDPYLGWGVPADKLYEWTKDFIPKLNALGKEVKLVTQGFAKKGEEDAAHAYNQQLLALPGISEFVNFGLEDWFPEGSKEAEDLYSSKSEWTPLNNDFQQQVEGRKSADVVTKEKSTEQQLPTQQSAQKSTTDPDWFKRYIYQGGADDATATQRGIDYVLSEGMRPQEAVNLWNQSLGTNFTAKDFYDATGIDLPKAPNAPPEGQMPNLSFFGREGGWDLASGAFVDPTRGRVYEPPSGVVFQRGNEVVVGDELFWSPYAPTGDKLKELVQQNQANGYRVGTVVSPYATLVGSQEGKEPPVTIKQLAQEVANSGVDFVAIDPYVGWFDIKSEDLVNWSKQFLDEMRALGKDTILVMQNDVPGANTKEEVFAHNKSLMNIPGFSEYVAYSEMPDEKDRLSGFFDEVYARLDRSEGKKNAGKPPEDRKVALNESTPPTRLAYGGGIGSLAYRMKR